MLKLLDIIMVNYSLDKLMQDNYKAIRTSTVYLKIKAEKNFQK